LDHFQGNRTPHTDPLSRGAFAGLTLRHTRGHMFRAALEGVAFGTRAVLEAMRARGYQPTRITIAGGAARSALWARITADVVGIPLVLTRNGEAPALGCAVLAAVAAGAYADVEAACAAMVHAERVITPDAKAHAAYARFYEAYASLYPALAPVVRAAGAAAAELDGTC
jgi:sugar (pentulose or hexulose) kinase